MNNKNGKGRLNAKWLVLVLFLMLVVYGLSWLIFGFWLKNRTNVPDGISEAEVVREQKPILEVKLPDRPPVFEPVRSVEAVDSFEITEWEDIGDASVAPMAQVLPPTDETPPGISLIGEIRYMKCYDSTGLQKNGNMCGKWDDFETTFKDRLYLVDRCRTAISGESAYGRLFIQMEVDRQEKTVGLWAGNRSNLRNTKKIVDCLEDQLAGLASVNDNSDIVRYQFEMGVSFVRQVQLPVAVAEMTVTSTHSEEKVEMTDSEALRVAVVIKDHVRVRKEPVDGEIIGKISSGNRVAMIEERDGWCRVRTPRNNIGWMICWALELKEENK